MPQTFVVSDQQLVLHDLCTQLNGIVPYTPAVASYLQKIGGIFVTAWDLRPSMQLNRFHVSNKLPHAKDVMKLTWSMSRQDAHGSTHNRAW